MDSRYRDEAEIHRVTPLIAVLVAAMTLATAPLTQAGTPAGESAVPSRSLERVDDTTGFTLAAGACTIEVAEPTCETTATVDSTGSTTAEHVHPSLVISSTTLPGESRSNDS